MTNTVAFISSSTIGTCLLANGYSKKSTLQGKCQMVAGAALLVLAYYMLDENIFSFPQRNISSTIPKECSEYSQEELGTMCKDLTSFFANKNQEGQPFFFNKHVSNMGVEKTPNGLYSAKCKVTINDEGKKHAFRELLESINCNINFIFPFGMGCSLVVEIIND